MNPQVSARGALSGFRNSAVIIFLLPLLFLEQNKLMTEWGIGAETGDCIHRKGIQHLLEKNPELIKNICLNHLPQTTTPQIDAILVFLNF